MCAKRQRRCPELVDIRGAALTEWAGAETCSTRRAPLSPQPERPPDLSEPIAPVQDPRYDVRARE